MSGRNDFFSRRRSHIAEIGSSSDLGSKVRLARK